MGLTLVRCAIASDIFLGRPSLCRTGSNINGDSSTRTMSAELAGTWIGLLASCLRNGLTPLGRSQVCVLLTQHGHVRLEPRRAALLHKGHMPRQGRPCRVLLRAPQCSVVSDAPCTILCSRCLHRCADGLTQVGERARTPCDAQRSAPSTQGGAFGRPF